VTDLSKPRLFLGSSSEGLQVAEVIEGHLQLDFEVRMWNQGVFLPGHYTMDSLENAARECMFAVIVGTADDVLSKRRSRLRTIRDNLVFEFGFFSGILGRRRTVLVTPKKVALALPSDIDGLTRATYARYAGPPTSKKWLESLQVVSREITTALLKERIVERRTRLEEDKTAVRERRRQAASRLYRAVTRLRDMCIELPTNALGAVGNKPKFDQVKADASSSVRTMEQEWSDDAELLAVKPQLAELVNVTADALLAFPYPAVHWSTLETQEVANRFLERVSAGSIADRFAGATQQGQQEGERKIAEFGKMYTDWWGAHGPRLRARANAVQDGVAKAMWE
jgi:hypothetical protein